MLVTAIMPVRNAKDTVLRALTSLKDGCEGINVRLLICDNESDDLVTNGLIRSDALHCMLNSFGFEDHRILDDCACHTSPETGIVLKHKNLEHMMAKFMYEMSDDTPDFVFRLDADVEMPSGGLKALLDRMSIDHMLGIVGIRYSDTTKHIQAGCTLYRYAALKVISDIGFGTCGCECRFIHEELMWRSWKAAHLKGWKANHMKEESNGVA